MNNVPIRDFLDYIKDCYCTITQDEIDKNMEVFYKGIDPTLPLAVITKRQEDCQEFYINARVPISQELMMTTGTKDAVNCGDFHQAWQEWRHLTTASQTWANWNTTGPVPYKRIDTQKITGGGI
jgi:hypothetical protein